MSDSTSSGRRTCLLIGPYGDEGTETRKWSDWVLKEIVMPAANRLGYSASRTIDETKPGDITQRIMRELQAADLVVADLTTGNPNVYYELALRHAMAKPFIHLIREGAELPFDIKVMEAIKIREGSAGPSMEKLIHQMQAVPTTNFTTAASWQRHPAKAFDWEITYATELADEWLSRQNRAVRDAVDKFNSAGGHPSEEFVKNSLIEYLTYRASHGTTISVDLYYVVIDSKYHRFKGWGVAPIVEGVRTQPQPLQVSGHEEDGGRRIVLQFNQPPAHVKLGDLEGVVGPFQYTIGFEVGEGGDGDFQGEFFHPKCPSVTVGSSVLRSKTG